MSEKLTWRQLRDAANDIPEELLDRPVVGWDSEKDDIGYTISEIEILNEDYVYDGDEGCAPLSIIKENSTDWEGEKDEHYTIHPKGTKILIVNS